MDSENGINPGEPHQDKAPDVAAKRLKEVFGLHNSPEIKKAADLTERKTGKKVPQDSLLQIQNYLDRIDHLFNPPKLQGHESFDRQERNKHLFKEEMYKRLVIPDKALLQYEGYWDNQRRILRERGQEGDLNYVNFEEIKKQQIEVVTQEQRESLYEWIDYLLSDDAPYSKGFKYYVFRSIINLSRGEKREDGSLVFFKRTFAKFNHEGKLINKPTTKPFPELNREALAFVLDVLERDCKGQDIDLSQVEQQDQQMYKHLVESFNFAKLYAYAIEKVTSASTEQLQQTQGEWLKFNKGSNSRPLVDLLQGHGTGWCTAGESVATRQLQGGDFYVYCSFDKDGKPTVPRIAIRMEGTKIAEVRGIAKDQNLDEGVTSIAEEKLQEFTDGKKYLKRLEDMKRMTSLDHKFRQGEKLSIEDLRFLYEIDSKIEGFGYSKDPRIDEILKNRDQRTDLSTIFNCRQDQISLTQEQALRGDIIYHFGNLNLYSLTSAKGLTLPEQVGGDLNLWRLTSAEGLTLPEQVGGDLNLMRLTSAEGLTLPKQVGGGLDLSGLTSAEGLTLPKQVGGAIVMPRLSTQEKTELRRKYPNLKIR